MDKKEYSIIYYKKNKIELDKKSKIRHEKWRLKEDNKKKSKEYNKKYYKENKDKIRKKNKEWRYRNNIVSVKYKDRVYSKEAMLKARFRCYKKGAKKRNHVFEIDIDYFEKILNKKCIYCGSTEYIGIDRIDNNIGYTIENSKPCCKYCNIMKMANSKIFFINRVKKIYNNLFN